MAGNDWINSYLNAILDVDPGINDSQPASLLLRERGRFSPARYFVEEVITGYDETDLHRSWARVSSTHSYPPPWCNLQIEQKTCNHYCHFRLPPSGILKKEILDWRTCLGGFGIWPARRNRSGLFHFFIFQVVWYFSLPHRLIIIIIINTLISISSFWFFHEVSLNLWCR